MQIERGKWVPIVCFKHDGSVHRSWNKTLIIDKLDKYLVLGNDDAMVFESDGRNWKVKEPAITIFSDDEWFNVIAMIRDDGIKYYVNLASPYVVNEGSICYIDYDLDISLKPGIPIRILDEHEYYAHLEQMNYNKKIDYILKKTLYNLLDKMERKEFPFIDEQIIELYNKFVEMKKENENNI